MQVGPGTQSQQGIATPKKTTEFSGPGASPGYKELKTGQLPEDRWK
jgi:hypothetical protein